MKPTLLYIILFVIARKIVRQNSTIPLEYLYDITKEGGFLVRHFIDRLPQLENINDEQQLSKYLPWSKELPQDILNFQGAPEGVTITE